MSGQQEVRRGDHHQLGVCSRNCVQEDPDFFAVVENDGEEEGMGRRWFQNGEREWGLGTRGGSGGESDLESIREKNEIDKARTELILGEVAAKEEKKFAADIARGRPLKASSRTRSEAQEETEQAVLVSAKEKEEMALAKEAEAKADAGRLAAE